MSASSSFQSWVEALNNVDVEPTRKLQVLTELRDSVEFSNPQVYTEFLQVFFPIFKSILEGDSTQNYEEKKLKTVILDLLSHLPQDSCLEPYASALLKTCLGLLQKSTDDLGTPCIKLIFGLYRHFRNTLFPYVRELVDFLILLYQNVRNMGSSYFLRDSSQQSSRSPIEVSYSQVSATSQRIVKSTESFRVLVECPLLVLYLVQLYPDVAKSFLPSLVASMFDTVSLEAAEPQDSSLKPIFQDFILCQVKIVQFFSFLIKDFYEYVQFLDKSIANVIVRLLRRCPSECVQSRKELLVATRHILGTSLRSSFASELENLIDESTLFGSSESISEGVKSLGYSFLAELVHLMRQDLSSDILKRVVSIFCKNILDTSLSLPVQFTSAKLLVSLSETVHNQSEGIVSKKALFARIIATFVERFESLIERIATLAHNWKYAEEQQMDTKSECGEDTYSWILNVASFEQLERWEEDLTTSFLKEFSDKDSKVPRTVDLAIIEREELHRNQIEKDIADCKLLVKTMMQGIRTVLTSLQLSDITDSGSIGNRQSYVGGVVNVPVNFNSRKLREEECLLMVRLLLLGCNCLGSLRRHRMTDEKEEKELVNQFSQIFTELNPKSFQEIFSVCISQLCNSILEQPFILQMFQHLIASQHLSKFCVNILLSYLTQHLYLLETETVPSNVSISTESSSPNDSKDFIESNGNSSIYLSLFKTLFASVTLFSDNEAALRPYIYMIVKGSLNRAKKSPNPHNYFRLLRAFFKSLTGGKFELLYKDMIPLLRVILEDLVSFLETGCFDACRNLLIELCLTIPARPSSILPHLTLHMRPLMLALQSDSPDIILLGLRTLEFWIEMLHPEYLESILETMQPTFMQALWNGVYNSSQRLASCFLKILGKLGGICRKYGSDILSLPLQHRKLEPFYLQLSETNMEGFELNMSELVELCSNILDDSYLARTLQMDFSSRDSLYMRKSAYFLLRSMTLLLLANDFSSKQQIISRVRNIVVSSQGRQMLERVLVERSEVCMRDSFYYFKDKERKVLTELVRDLACIAANSTLNSLLHGEPQEFFHQLSEYFVFHWIFVDAETKSTDNYAVPLSMVVALFQLMEDGSFDMMEFSLSTICKFIQVFKDILGQELFRYHPVLIFCLNSFVHFCYSRRLALKVMAIKGIMLGVESIDENIILNPLSDVFFLHILRGVFSMIRDAEDYPNRFLSDLEKLKDLLISKVTGEQLTWKKHAFPLELYTLFASELCSSSEACRLWAEKMITAIANALQVPVFDAFNVTFDQCLKILLMKSIRFSSFGKQVAYISMACFLMESGIITPDLFGLGIQGDDEFEKVIMESSQETSSEHRIADFHMLLKNILIIADDTTHNRLVEADDMALYKLVDNRLTDEGVIRYIAPLKIHCLKFIKSLITCIGSHFRNLQEPPTYLSVWTSNKACNELLQKIYKILFQSLESNNEEISCLSIDSLHLLIEQHCLSKEDLHNNLKPLLSAFGDSHKLSVRCLQGLERVLSLFSSWFNRAIIEKLLEHLKVFIHSCMQNQESPVNLDWRLPVGVARIFAKLPPSVIEYQDAFFKSLLQLEDFVNMSIPPLKILESTRSVCFSPFREPALSFCNAFPKESLDYLFKMIANERFRHLFLSLIEAKDAEPMRKALMESCVRYIETLVEDGVSGLEWPSILVSIVVIRVLSTWQPSWLQENTVVYKSLHRLWQVFFVQSLFSEEFLNDLEFLDAARQLVQVVILYYCRNLYQMDVLFLLFSLFGRERHLMDFTFVKKFLNNSEEEYDIVIPLVEVFNYFLQVASDASTPPFVLSSCLQLYLIPSLERSFRDSPGSIQIPKHLFGSSSESVT
ncbi:Transcription-associated protein 1 [Galdieria sulphuraria]|nr:Transcription-associated protein 1 [Galdieria sulphuraria]